MSSTHAGDSKISQAVYTRQDVANLLGISERHVDRMSAANQIPGILRVGRLVRFGRAIIDRWMAGEYLASGDQRRAGA